MQDLILFLANVFIGFFAMLNPIGSTPVILSIISK
jgi:small neutral amino acid transporter SnatA (MarC family)